MWDAESHNGPSIIQRLYGDGSDDNDGGANIDGSVFRSLIMNPPMMGTADDEILWARQMLNAFGHVNTVTSDKSVFIDLVLTGREGRVIADGLCRRGLLGKMGLTTDDRNMVLPRLLVECTPLACREGLLAQAIDHHRVNCQTDSVKETCVPSRRRLPDHGSFPTLLADLLEAGADPPSSPGCLDRDVFTAQRFGVEEE